MRIQLELSENSVAQIKELMRVAGIKTYSDLFGNSLAILNWAVKETRKGRKVVSVDQQKSEAITELAMPVLDAAGATPLK